MRARRAPAVRANAVIRSLAQIERAYTGNDDLAVIDVKLSPIALRILAEVAKRSDAQPSEIVDDLLRTHGPAMISA